MDSRSNAEVDRVAQACRLGRRNHNAADKIGPSAPEELRGRDLEVGHNNPHRAARGKNSGNGLQERQVTWGEPLASPQIHRGGEQAPLTYRTHPSYMYPVLELGVAEPHGRDGHSEVGPNGNANANTRVPTFRHVTALCRELPADACSGTLGSKHGLTPAQLGLLDGNNVRSGSLNVFLRRLP